MSRIRGAPSNPRNPNARPHVPFNLPTPRHPEIPPPISPRPNNHVNPIAPPSFGRPAPPPSDFQSVTPRRPTYIFYDSPYVYIPALILVDISLWILSPFLGIIFSIILITCLALKFYARMPRTSPPQIDITVNHQSPERQSKLERSFTANHFLTPFAQNVKNDRMTFTK